MTPFPGASVRPPGKVSAIGGMMLGGGILSVLWAIAVAGGSACLWIVWIYQLVVGILCIVHGSRMLGDRNYPPSRTLPILMMICILNCDAFTMVLGILCLIFANDPDVRDWYVSRGITY